MTGEPLQRVASEHGVLTRAKALSAPTRVELLAHLRDAAEPLTAGELAVLLGVHHTAVRQHLGVLLDAGLVHPQRLPVVGRGRPRTGYVAGAVDRDGAYRELAGMLADAVRTGASARAAGREAGRQVVPLPAGPLATLRREAERLGFRPELHDDGATHEVVLHSCPFAELAILQPETVCELHLGLAEGIAERSGAMAVDGIVVREPRTGGCRIMVRDVEVAVALT